MRLNEFAIGNVCRRCSCSSPFHSRLSKRLNVIKKVCPWSSTQKNADGTAKNALDVKDNIWAVNLLKDKYIVTEYTMKQEQIAEKSKKGFITT